MIYHKIFTDESEPASLLNLVAPPTVAAGDDPISMRFKNPHLLFDRFVNYMTWPVDIPGMEVKYFCQLPALASST